MQSSQIIGGGSISSESRMNKNKKQADAALLNAAAYHSGHLDAVASIRCGLAQACNGQGRPADVVFDELEREDTGR